MQIKYVTAYCPHQLDFIVAISVIQFNGGHAHIAVYNDCWVVIARDKCVTKLFREAMLMLKTLPNDPNDYPPYKNYKSGNSKLQILK